MNKIIEALRNGQQCDEDGVMCIVSRQACNEAADEIERLRGLLSQAVDWNWMDLDAEGVIPNFQAIIAAAEGR